MKNIDNWIEIIKDYKYDLNENITRDYLINKIQKKGLITYSEDYNIINEIVLWKINRRINLSSETIEYINSVTRNVKTIEDALNSNDVKNLLDEMLKQKGIRLPMASTILHFYNPNVFPIIDQRSYRELFNKKLNLNANSEIYLLYLQRCKNICERYKIPIKLIDIVLYQLDKNKGNKNK